MENSYCMNRWHMANNGQWYYLKLLYLRAKNRNLATSGRVPPKVSHFSLTCYDITRGMVSLSNNDLSCG